jgi:hypothetical protein
MMKNEVNITYSLVSLGKYGPKILNFNNNNNNKTFNSRMKNI